jgi:hypothetical protein
LLANGSDTLLNKFDVKVADFGLSRAIDKGYYKKQDSFNFPVKWTATGSIKCSFHIFMQPITEALEWLFYSQE